MYIKQYGKEQKDNRWKPSNFKETLQLKLSKYLVNLESKINKNSQYELGIVQNAKAGIQKINFNSIKNSDVKYVTVEVIKSLLETALIYTSERPQISALIHNTVTEIFNEYFSVSPSMADIEPIKVSTVKKAKLMGRKTLSGMAGLTQFLLTPALLVTAYVIDPFYSIADNLITGNVSFDPLYSDIANTLNNARDKMDYVTQQKQKIQEGIVKQFNEHLTMAKRRIPGYVPPQKKNKTTNMMPRSNNYLV